MSASASSMSTSTITFINVPPFKNVTFRVCDGIRLTLDVSYIQGNPICKTKTLMLYYHSDEPIIATSSSKLGKMLMKKGLDTQFAVNLLNCLNKIVNGINLYHVYKNEDDSDGLNLQDCISHKYGIAAKKSPKFNEFNDSNDSDDYKNSNDSDNSSENSSISSDSNDSNDSSGDKHKDLTKQRLMISPRTGRYNQTSSDNAKPLEFFKNLLDSSNHVIRSILDTKRDPKCPLILKSLQKLTFVPVWCYVSRSGKIQGANVEHICHLAFILERLVHNSDYPEFNNQAALALLNVSQQSEQTHLSIERLNISAYQHECERHKFYKTAFINEKSEHAKTREKLDKVIEQQAELIDTCSGLKEQNKELKEKNEELVECNHQLSANLSIAVDKLNLVRED